MKSKKIILLAGLLFIAIAGLGTMLIRAWLTDKKETPPTELTVGNVSFELNGEFTSGPVVPGQELFYTQYSVKNNSNVDTQIRFKLTVTSEVTGTATSNLYTFTPGSDWTFNELDGFYYYNGTSGEVAAPAEAGTTIALTQSLKLNGATVGNLHQGKKFTFTFLFHAKQADYVTWTEMGSINFETGLAS